jgi:hypothetical protein
VRRATRLISPLALGGAYCSGLVSYLFGLMVDQFGLVPGPADLLVAGALMGGVGVVAVAILTRSLTRPFFWTGVPVVGVGFGTGWVLWKLYQMLFAVQNLQGF